MAETRTRRFPATFQAQGTVKVSAGRLAARNFPSRLLMKLAR
jgi:hypothetical protein